MIAEFGLRIAEFGLNGKDESFQPQKGLMRLRRSQKRCRLQLLLPVRMCEAFEELA